MPLDEDGQLGGGVEQGVDVAEQVLGQTVVGQRDRERVRVVTNPGALHRCGSFRAGVVGTTHEPQRMGEPGLSVHLGSGADHERQGCVLRQGDGRAQVLGSDPRPPCRQLHAAHGEVGLAGQRGAGSGQRQRPDRGRRCYGPVRPGRT